MRVLLALLVALPNIALSQGLNPSPPGGGQKRTNYLARSNEMTVGTAAQSPWSISDGSTNLSTPGAAPASVGGGTWAKAVATQFNGVGLLVQTPTFPSSKVLTVSVYHAKESGTGSASVIVGCGAAPSSCSCSLSNGQSCSAAVAYTNYCRFIGSNIGTDPVRITTVTTCPSAVTSSAINLYPGADGTAIGTGLFAGAQLEVSGASKASKICVTTTAAKTCTN